MPKTTSTRSFETNCCKRADVSLRSGSTSIVLAFLLVSSGIGVNFIVLHSFDSKRFDVSVLRGSFFSTVSISFFVSSGIGVKLIVSHSAGLPGIYRINELTEFDGAIY